MSLAEELTKHLNGLSPFANSLTCVHVADGDITMRAELLSLDRLACEFDALVWETSRLAAIDTTQLSKMGGQLASRIHYLLEPIGPVELDFDRCILQMRSTVPSSDGHQKSFYELVICKGGSATLCRYAATGKQVKERVTASITRQVLERLTKDVTEVLRAPLP